MRTIYLQHSLSINGRQSLRGRHLVDRLRTPGDDLLLGHMIVAEEVTDHEDREDLISHVEMLQFDPDVIYLEGGLFTGRGGGWRIERPLAEEFVAGGGTLIVADVDWNILNEQRADYAEVADFLGAAASYSDSEPVGGYDEDSFWLGTKQILCRPPDMVVSDWLLPIYRDIPEILVMNPVRLESFHEILASGNRDSTWSDATDGIPGPDNLPFASVSKWGNGFVVLICGSVSGDRCLEGGPHNTTWLVSTARFLSDATRADRHRAGSVIKASESLFLSHAQADKQLVAQVHELLRREHFVGAWLDQAELLAGDSLPQRIENNIRSASGLVLFWSQFAAKSEWVRRELEIALEHAITVLVVRLDDTGAPAQLANLLRIECQDLAAADIARALTEAVQRRRKRERIEQARSGLRKAPKSTRESPPPPWPTGASLVRGANDLPAPSVAPLPVGGVLPAPEKIGTLGSSYRIDILSFLDTGLLVSGSGDFAAQDIERARARGLFDEFRKIHCQTGMDGHLDDHRATRRHLLYGYESMQVFDRAAGRVVAEFNCDADAAVMSAAWSPAGDRIVVGTDNNLVVASDRGEIITQRNLYARKQNSAPKSVVWQPSERPLYATGKRVCVADADGRVIHELTDLDSNVLAVAVAPCGRFIAAVGMNGEVVVWSETGTCVATLQGIPCIRGWRASRCLAFSPDSRFLVQAASTGGAEFAVFELATGRSARVAAAGANVLAFHPLTGVLAVVAGKRIDFWELPGEEG